MRVKLGHRPVLDALRGGAVVAVVGYHAGFPAFDFGGVVGVEVFLVLSGFLITSLLLDRPTLSDFYRRRARRLLPALFVLLAVCTAIAVLAGDADTLAGIAWSGLYAANIGRIHGVDLGVLGHLWSLAVEEHFYLLWPLVVVGLRTPRRVLAAAIVLGFGFAVWRWHLPNSDRVFYGTDTRAVGLFAGSALAAARHLVSVDARRTVGLAAAGMLAAFVAVMPFTGYSAQFAVIDAATVAVICGTLTMTVAPRVLSWFGRISYALYLWHWPLLIAARGDHAGNARAVAAVVLSVGAAVVSTRFVESRWRSRHRDGLHHQSAPPDDRRRVLGADDDAAGDDRVGDLVPQLVRVAGTGG